MSAPDPHRSAAIDLAAALRAGDLRSRALVDAHIERIEAVNPLINALVADRFAAARAEADDADRRLDAARRDGGLDALPPLLGVPCTIKEFFSVQGLPKTGGMLARRDALSVEDAPTVARMRAAGMVVLGVSNVPEGGLWMESINLVYGRTNNPWDLRRTPGGSSGGEGALVAAGCSPVGLGSDIGGSIRIPAAMCGTFGHKPSVGLVPNTGQFPDMIEDGTSAYLGSGPLTRSARDLYPLVSIMAGPDGVDPWCHERTLVDPATVDIGRLRVIPVPTNGRFHPAPVMQDAVQRATDSLVAAGARRVDARVERLQKAFEIWSAMLGEASGTPYAEILGQGQAIGVVGELARHLVGRPRYSWDALVVTAGEVLGKVMPGMQKKLADEGAALREELDALLGDDGVIIHPPYTRPAPVHRGAWTTFPHSGYTSIFNVMQAAVTVVPMGFDERGLPVTVQVIGRAGMDHLTMAAALALEAAGHTWTMADPRPHPSGQTWGEVQAKRVAEGREPWPPP